MSPALVFCAGAILIGIWWSADPLIERWRQRRLVRANRHQRPQFRQCSHVRLKGPS